jgi:excisionase family DNA binding protein
MTPAEVATAFRVDPKTVTRWARAGKLTSIRTLGGHRRYLESEVRAILSIAACEPEPHEPEPTWAAWEPPGEDRQVVGLGSGSVVS